MELSYFLHVNGIGDRVRLLSGEKGITIGKNENFEFPLWEIKLENGKILTEARYRFDVLTEPEVSNDHDSI
jgi:hypothetical protein